MHSRYQRRLLDTAAGGGDEFALRKGRRYGTLLVDVETRRPVDILDERSSDSFAAWLASRARVRSAVLPDRGSSEGRRRVDGLHGRHLGPGRGYGSGQVLAVAADRPLDNLADNDKASLDAILAASPELAAVTASVRAFAAMMNERRGRKLLEPWMTTAEATGEPALRSFVTALRADQDAVTSGLSLPWSSGAVEGHVNRIKMLKRQMYGRANPDLLRLRVLLAD